VLALTGAVALSLAAPAARAATTIGHTFTPTLKCVTSTFVQKSEASGVTSYAVPAGGAVITSFSTMAYSEPNEQMSFKVFRPTGTANEYTIVASTPTELLTPSALNTFPVRFPVKAGDRIGVYSDNAPCLTTSAGSEVLYDIGDFAPGITQTYSHPGAALLTCRLSSSRTRTATASATKPRTSAGQIRRPSAPVPHPRSRERHRWAKR